MIVMQILPGNGLVPIEFPVNSDGFEYPNGKKAPWGFWSSEITDVDKDGFVDIILGGSYKENSEVPIFMVLLWGDGTGNYYSERSTTLFDWRNLDYAEETLYPYPMTMQ